VRDATFCPADLTTFCRLDDLGLDVVGQQLHPDHAVLLCRVVWRATILHVRIRRYRCSGCGQVWRQDTTATAAAAPRAKLSTQAVMWALKSVVIDRMSIARIVAGLGVSWHTVNDAVLATGHQLLIAEPTRFDGVQVLGVDEHAWRHTRRGDKFVTVIIDLTPVRDGTGPSGLLDMVEGRSKQVFKTWLEAQTPAFRDGIANVAMDGFTGFKTAANGNQLIGQERGSHHALGRSITVPSSRSGSIPYAAGSAGLGSEPGPAPSGAGWCSCVVRGNPVGIRDCPAAVSRNDRRHQRWVADVICTWEATASRSIGNGACL
jgi:hypothetical protein